MTNIPVDKAGLTFAQHEANAIISEEAGEVVQACGKLFRHGMVANDYAVEPPVRYDNGRNLLREVADLIVAVHLASRVGLLPDLDNVDREMNCHISRKLHELRKRTHAPELVAAIDDMIEEDNYEEDEDGQVA